MMEFISFIIGLALFVWAIAILCHFNVVINQLKKNEAALVLVLQEIKKQNC
jgi:hypothetical protein